MKKRYFQGECIHESQEWLKLNTEAGKKPSTWAVPSPDAYYQASSQHFDHVETPSTIE